MNRTIVSLVLVMFVAVTLAADDQSDVIVQAHADATADGKSYHPYWWGIGGAAITGIPVLITAFFANGIPVEARRVVALTSPVVGGAGLALIGYSTGKARVPDARIAEIQNRYGAAGLVSLYESEYEKALTKIQRRKKGNSVLIGFGATAGAVLGFGLLVIASK